MNLFEQQASNRRKTWLVMLAFVAFFLLLGFGFDAFYLGAAGGAVPIGTVVALGVGSVSAAASYFSGDRAVLRATFIADLYFFIFQCCAHLFFSNKKLIHKWIIN